jgi:hypothetical protein
MEGLYMAKTLSTELYNDLISESLELGKTRYLILSRGRSRTIVSHKMFPFADVIVPEYEKALYEKKIKKAVLTYPDNIHGLSILRNYILRKFTEEIIIMIDDDIDKLYNQEFNTYTRITDPIDIKRILDSTAAITKDLGKSLFGYKPSRNITFYDPTNPFRLNGWVGTVIGIVGRKYYFDEHNILKTDIDYSLQCLLEDRIIIQDMRYVFDSIKIKNSGGNSTYRTKDRVESEQMYLKRKWGKHIVYVVNEDGETTKINVKRNLRNK